MDKSLIKIKTKELSETINELINKGAVSDELALIEKWLTEQLKAIGEFKKREEPLLFNKHIFRIICLDSVLLLNLDFTIKENYGFFSYFFSAGKDKGEHNNFLEFIKEDYRAEFLVSCKKSKIVNKHFLFETKIQTPSALCFKVIYKVKFLTERSQYKLSINNIQLCEGNRNRILFCRQAEMISKLPGVHLILFNCDYKILDYYGNGSILQNNYSGGTLFDSFEQGTIRKLYSFINKTLKGLQSEGKISITQNIFDVHAFSVKDEDGFTDAALLLLKDSSELKGLI